QVRELIRRLGFKPMLGDCRVVIINQAELMGVEAANAFLKTLEEPPRGTTFALTAPDSGQVLPTIRSRCQRVPFALAPDAIVADVLRARQGLGRVEAERVAALAGGRIGRALQMDLSRLDEMDRALDLALGGSLDRQAAFELSGQLGSDRESARVFLDGLAQRLRCQADSRDMETRRAAVRGFEMVLAARRDLERQANIRLVLDGLLVGMERRRS
ncbi:MAG: DNA polymerase III subunit delta', partial [Proteobacteria bacterium]|nr:DNA polymerase III subunit delta' [Pseudomonadota bacterium]